MLLFFSIGHLVLSVMVLWLFGSSVLGSFNNKEYLVIVLNVILLLAILYQLVKEYSEKVLPVKSTMKFEGKDILNFIAVFGGTMITFYLSQEIIAKNYPMFSAVVMGSGLVGIFATLIFPKYDVPIFCGSFAGMAAPALLPTYSHVALAGAIASTVFVLAKYSLNGFGGKLGTTAFSGCIIAALVTNQPFCSGTIPAWDFGLHIILWSIIGAVLTFVINTRFKNSPVISSGAVAVLLGIILPQYYSQAQAVSLAIMVFCASFAGMSNNQRIPNELYMIVAGVFAGITYMFTSPYFCGGGGKLGTTAFGSVLAVGGLISFANKCFAPKPTTQQEA